MNSGATNRRTGSKPFKLRQVIAERSEEHIFVRLRIDPLSGPTVPSDPRVLRPRLQRAFWTLIEAIPEARRALENVLGLSRAF